MSHFSTSFLRALQTGILVAILGSSVWAQRLQYILPVALPIPAQKTDLDPEKLTDKRNVWGITASVPLRGVVFVPSATDVKEAGLPVFDGIRMEHLGPLEAPDFQTGVRSLLGKSLSRDVLNEITEEVVVAYQQMNQPIIEAFVPNQNVENGVLQVVVVEGKVGMVKVRGNKWFRSDVIIREYDAQTGTGVSENQRLENLASLNRNPFYTVTPEYVEGSEPGTKDLILHTKDRFPIATYSGFSNTGNAITGYDRWTNGIYWGNAFGQNNELDYQITNNNLKDRYIAQTARYIIPLPSAQSLYFYGGYITERGQLPTILHGYSWQTSGRYMVPLKSYGDYEQSFTTGIDFKESNSSLDFGGTKVLANPTDIFQFADEYKSSYKDAWGVTTLDSELYLSPGGITGQNQSAAFQFQHSGAHADYIYGKATMTRDTRLPYDFHWWVKGVVQDSSTNLLPSEALGLGGVDSIRGYEEHLFNKDQGWTLTSELRLPPLRPVTMVATQFDRAVPEEKLQFLGFIDYGWGRNIHLQPGEAANTYLMGVGPGFIYSLGQNVSIKCSYGFQLRYANKGDNDSERFHLAVNIGF